MSNRIRMAACRLRGGASLLALLLLLAAPAVLPTGGALAQRVSADAAPRTVAGHVTEGGGAPAAGAVVYLKDTRTMAVRSFIADGSGSYHFGQLSPTTDYEVWAEQGGHKSKTHRISSFDAKTSYDFTLEV